MPKKKAKSKPKKKAKGKKTAYLTHSWRHMDLPKKKPKKDKS